MLTVTSGTGTGNYLAGTIVNISAAAAPSGKLFDKWIGDIACVANPNLPNTTITTPASDASVYATYMDIPTTLFTLTVASGTGGGRYKAGTFIPISAFVPAGAKVFSAWIGDIAYVSAVSVPNTAFTMPAADAMVSATYKDAPPDMYTLTVENGSGVNH